MEENLKHYLDDFGHPSDIPHHDKDSSEIFDVLVPVWNIYVNKNLPREKFSQKLMTYIRELEWKTHDVAYDLEISESLNGLGGNNIDEIYSAEKDMDKVALFNCLKRWKAAGYYRAEFLLYLHDMLMTMTINLYFQEESSGS